MSKRWFPLESNPQVMANYVSKLGFPIDQYTFHDVLSTEDWAFGMIPQPVLAVVMLFPIKDKSEQHKEEERQRIEEHGQEVSDKVYYMKQTVGNACGTIGLLHAIGNARDHVAFEKGSFLDTFLTETVDKSSDEIATILENDKQLEETHGSAAQSGQSELQAVEVPINTHFICFTCVDGALYELDGRKQSPINHGSSSPETILPDACKVIQEFMKRDPEEVRFTIIALAKTE